MMTQRLDYSKVDPRALEPLYKAGAYLAKSTLEPALQHFVTLRASQINGCAFCIALHNRELAEVGESGDRVWGLPGAKRHGTASASARHWNGPKP